MREGYKKTLAGYLPLDWEYDKLENLTIKITDGTHKTPVYTESGIPFLRVTDIQGSYIDFNNIKYISKEEHEELIKRCKPEKGDILYSKNGTIGIPKIIDWDFDFSIFVSLCLIKMKSDSKIINKYLEQYLKSNSCMKQIELRTKQGTVKNLHLEEIRELIIPIPPLKEQEKIAEILSTVDSQIDDTEKLIEKSKELKKGLMQKLLTKGIGHSEFKKTEVGEIPVEWEVKKLSEVADFRNGKAHEKNICEYSDFIVVNSKFISSDGNVKKYSNTCISPLRKDDLAMVMSDVPNGKAIAKCFFVDQNNKYTLNQRICALTTRVMNSRYLYYYLNRNKYFLKFDDGVKQTNLRKEEVLECPVLIPKLEEQEKIVYILSSVDSEIEEYENEKQKLEELKKGLMQQLLRGKIRTF